MKELQSTVKYTSSPSLTAFGQSLVLSNQTVKSLSITVTRIIGKIIKQAKKIVLFRG